MFRRHGLVALCFAFTGACAPPRAAESSADATDVVSVEQHSDSVAAPTPRATIEPGAVEKLARPLKAKLSSNSAELSEEVFLTKLASAAAVCIGENHESAEDHYLQLAVVRGLLERRSMRGFELGVGLEMVQQSKQSVLNNFDSGRLSLDDLEEKTSWESDWGYSFELFRPQLRELKIFGGVRTLGLGVSRQLSHRIAEVGLAGLNADDQRKLPELDRSRAEHRKLFDGLMGGHPHGDLEKMYEAQLVWDESMAQVSARFLAERAPIRKLVIFAGAAHCHRSGIPSRVERRTPVTVVSVLFESEGQPSEVRDGYDYLVRFD